MRARKIDYEFFKRQKENGLLSAEIPDYCLPENNSYYKEIGGAEDFKSDLKTQAQALQADCPEDLRVDVNLKD